MAATPPWIRALRHKAEAGILEAALFLGRRLPLRARGLPRLVGTVLRAAAPREVASIARANLRLALSGRFSAEGREAILDAHFRHLASLGLELLEAAFLGWDRFDARTQVVGEERLRRASSQGRGVVCLSAHLGNWEWIAAFMARRGFGVTVVTRSLKNPALENRLSALRTSFGLRMVDRTASPRALLDALRRNDLVALLGDVDAKVDSLVLPFFGVPAACPVGPVSLARAARAPLLPGFSRRLPDGRYEVRFEAPIPVDRETRGRGRVGAALSVYNRLLEEAILRAPEQWLWGQKRWLRRAPGEDVKHWGRRMKRARQAGWAVQEV